MLIKDKRLILPESRRENCGELIKPATADSLVVLVDIIVMVILITMMMTVMMMLLIMNTQL